MSLFKCNLRTPELGRRRPQEVLTLIYYPRNGFLCTFHLNLLELDFRSPNSVLFLMLG